MDVQTQWMHPQTWVRDTERPCVSLGESDQFDDMHIFAPCVVYENGEYRLWYSGSRGDVDERVFQLGLAISTDGIHFTKHDSPVYAFGDNNHSVLTPTLLRNPDGSLLRENGALRMWFSSTTFAPGDPHTLHETTSEDGIQWTPPSPSQLLECYAPTVIKEGDKYKLWYTDVTNEPWCYRYGQSSNGSEWDVHPDPILQLDQAWEHGRLFYPTVLKSDGLYLMWYGSYQSSNPQTTALGLAISTDGIHWQKNPNNPILQPDPSREWESHYTTSQTVLRLADNSWRIWYGSRTKPPFVHKYFAIGTAKWTGHCF